MNNPSNPENREFSFRPNGQESLTTQSTGRNNNSFLSLSHLDTLPVKSDRKGIKSMKTLRNSLIFAGLVGTPLLSLTQIQVPDQEGHKISIAQTALNAVASPGPKVDITPVASSSPDRWYPSYVRTKDEPEPKNKPGFLNFMQTNRLFPRIVRTWFPSFNVGNVTLDEISQQTVGDFLTAQRKKEGLLAPYFNEAGKAGMLPTTDREANGFSYGTLRVVSGVPEDQLKEDEVSDKDILFTVKQGDITLQALNVCGNPKPPVYPKPQVYPTKPPEVPPTPTTAPVVPSAPVPPPVYAPVANINQAQGGNSTVNITLGPTATPETPTSTPIPGATPTPTNTAFPTPTPACAETACGTPTRIATATPILGTPTPRTTPLSNFPTPTPAPAETTSTPTRVATATPMSASPTPRPNTAAATPTAVRA